MNISERMCVKEYAQCLPQKCKYCYLYLSQDVKCLDECNIVLHDTDRVTPEMSKPVFRFRIVGNDVFVSLNGVSVYYVSWFIKNNFDYFIELTSQDIHIHHLFQNVYDANLIKGIFQKEHAKTNHSKLCIGLRIVKFGKIIYNMFNNLQIKNSVLFPIRFEKVQYNNTFVDLLYMSRKTRQEKIQELFELNKISGSTYMLRNDYYALDIARDLMSDYIREYNRSLNYGVSFEAKEDEAIIDHVSKLQSICDPYAKKILSGQTEISTALHKWTKLT